jgi:hypothetical protein
MAMTTRYYRPIKTPNGGAPSVEFGRKIIMECDLPHYNRWTLEVLQPTGEKFKVVIPEPTVTLQPVKG